MEIQLKECLINLDNVNYNVCIPEIVTNTIFACHNSQQTTSVYSDAPGLTTLASIFAYSASHPDAIVYLPLSQYGLTRYLARREGEQSAKDIVITHIHQKLELNTWRSLRMALHVNLMIPHAISISAECKDDVSGIPNESLTVRDAMETLFFVGESKAFNTIAETCRALIRRQSEDPIFHPLDSGVANAAEINLYHRYQTPLTFEFYDEKLWGE